MDVVIHGRALLAMDALQPAERRALQQALDTFPAGIERGRLAPQTALESNGVWWLLVSPTLRAVLRRSPRAAGQFELIDIVRPETLRNLFPETVGRSVACGGVA